MIRVITKLL